MRYVRWGGALSVIGAVCVACSANTSAAVDECGATRLDWGAGVIQGNTCDGTDHGDLGCGSTHVPDAFYRLELPANQTCSFHFSAGLNAAYGEIGAACTDFSTCQSGTVQGGTVSFNEPTPRSIRVLIETTATACGPFTLTVDGCTP